VSWSAARELSATRSGRLVVAALVVAAVAVVGVVALGRRERQSWIDRQVRGMQRIRTLVGPLDQRQLVGYRVLPQFDCLVYQRGENPFALELCVDGAGRLVEAIDRTSADHRYPSLRAEPTASPLHVDRHAVDVLLRRMGAPT
jgi:hypothetical protein